MSPIMRSRRFKRPLARKFGRAAMNSNPSVWISTPHSLHQGNRIRQSLRDVAQVLWLKASKIRAAHAQLLAEAAGMPKLISPDVARLTASQVGTHRGGYFSFQPLWDWVVAKEPDLPD
jgi:hypothetical protein